MRYLVTTHLSQIPTDHQIIMVDGTVPGWVPRPQDRHWDHHRPGGAEIQIDEMPFPQTTLLQDCQTQQPPCLVTPQVDADACCAAAWVQLPRRVLEQPEVVRQLRAIAWDCDHLRVPIELSDLAEFAAKAVIGLRSTGAAIVTDLLLPADRQLWSAKDWEHYMSESFKRDTEWLIAAAQGDQLWPGEDGEADDYWQGLKNDAEQLQREQRIQLLPSDRGSIATCDLRGIGRYVDPRAFHLALRNLAELSTLRPETLVIREHKYGGVQYTLGSLPDHPQTQHLDYTQKTFGQLTQAERSKDPRMEGWGGRRTVGGSGWNTPSQLTPAEIVKLL